MQNIAAAVLMLGGLGLPALAAEPSALEKEGEAIFRSKPCLGCHRMGEEGSDVACDLTRVGKRRPQEWLEVWLQYPALLRPGTEMPNPKLSAAEARAIAAYLASRKELPKPRPSPSP